MRFGGELPRPVFVRAGSRPEARKKPRLLPPGALCQGVAFWHVYGLSRVHLRHSKGSSGMRGCTEQSRAFPPSGRNQSQEYRNHGKYYLFDLEQRSDHLAQGYQRRGRRRVADAPFTEQGVARGRGPGGARLQWCRSLRIGSVGSQSTRRATLQGEPSWSLASRGESGGCGSHGSGSLGCDAGIRERGGCGIRYGHDPKRSSLRRFLPGSTRLWTWTWVTIRRGFRRSTTASLR